MKGDKLYQKISHFMETVTSRLIHDIIVYECILNFVKQLRHVTDNRYLQLSSFHNKVHFFLQEIIFSYFLSESRYIHTVVLSFYQDNLLIELRAYI